MYQKACKEEEGKITLTNVCYFYYGPQYTDINIASEPRLARQQEEMKSAWDQELEDIALDRRFGHL